MGRTPCCSAEGLKKGTWTADEDQKLIAHIQKHGEGGWRTLPQKAGLQRCGKSCRLRWANYLRPDIKRGGFSAEDEETITQLHAIRGNKWSAIARHLPGRTDNEIKNHWNTHLKKRLVHKGINPVTHKPIDSAVTPPQNNPENVANTSVDSGQLESKSSPISQSRSSRSTSVSAQLLNKVATKLSLTVSYGALSKIILEGVTTGGGGSDNSNDNNNVDFSNYETDHVESSTVSLNSSESQSKNSGSTSISRLLNKMATSPSTMLKAILPTTEGSPCSDDHGGGFDVDMGRNFYVECPAAKSTSSLSDNGLEISKADLSSTATISELCCLDDWQVIIGNDGGASDIGVGGRYNNMESPMSTFSNLSPDDHKPFMFAEFLDTNMAFESPDAPANFEDTSSIEGLTGILVDEKPNNICSGETESGALEETTMNSWSDDLDLESYGLLDYGTLDSSMF